MNLPGVHRSMGTHISKVRSTELDQNIWTDGLIDVSDRERRVLQCYKMFYPLQLIVNIGNKNSNEFWEKHCQQSEKLAADVERYESYDVIPKTHNTIFNAMLAIVKNARVTS